MFHQKIPNCLCCIKFEVSNFDAIASITKVGIFNFFTLTWIRSNLFSSSFNNPIISPYFPSTSSFSNLSSSLTVILYYSQISLFGTIFTHIYVHPSQNEVKMDNFVSASPDWPTHTSYHWVYFTSIGIILIGSQL